MKKKRLYRNTRYHNKTAGMNKRKYKSDKKPTIRWSIVQKGIFIMFFFPKMTRVG